MELDQDVEVAAANGERTPHDDFSAQRFRQPTLNEGKLKPSLYRHGKTMLPESVYGKAATGSFRRASMGGNSPRREPGFIEAGNGGKVFIVSPLSQSGVNPLHAMEESIASEARARAQSLDVEGDDIDEFEEEDVQHQDVDAAVDALLEDENKKTAVNTVSEQISALRRSSVMGASAVPGFRRTSITRWRSPMRPTHSISSGRTSPSLSPRSIFVEVLRTAR